MPAKNNARKSNPRKGGRPFGSVTRFPGSCVFAEEIGVTPAHVYRVLMGERQSRSLVAKYAEFLAQRSLPWPQDAKVNPNAA